MEKMFGRKFYLSKICFVINHFLGNSLDEKHFLVSNFFDRKFFFLQNPFLGIKLDVKIF
jgi:hypothetical protein